LLLTSFLLFCSNPIVPLSITGSSCIISYLINEHLILNYELGLAFKGLNYLFELNAYLIIPLWSSIKLYCFSLDVIHSISFYSFGIKVDVVPGRINLTSSLRSLIKGVNRGFCYESCGEQHNTMLNV
jgi:heme/copper-type cytochrome/quinol oxidase subunit 2